MLMPLACDCLSKIPASEELDDDRVLIIQTLGFILILYHEKLDWEIEILD